MKNLVVHKKDPHDVYIGRPSVWGNNFTHIEDRKTIAKYIVNTREEAIDRFEESLRNSPYLMARLPELRGKVLGCWCKPLDCHGDRIVKVLDEYTDQQLRSLAIVSFRGKYSFLSNFYEATVTLDGDRYKSVENAYIAAKSDNPDWRKFCQIENANVCKYESRTLILPIDWHEIKVNVMRDLLRQKFKNTLLSRLLLETEEIPIFEGNDWGDTFWGIDNKTGKGENTLGKLLMEIRAEIK